MNQDILIKFSAFFHHKFVQIRQKNWHGALKFYELAVSPPLQYSRLTVGELFFLLSTIYSI